MNRTNRPIRTYIGALLKVSVGLSTIALGTALFGATPRTKTTDLAPVLQVLESEASGTIRQRDEMLADVTKNSPDVQEARWHSGYVRWNKEWKRYDEAMLDPALEKKMHLYYGLRDESKPTVASQMQLATWCRQNDLEEQERAHLTNVLELDPDNEAVRFRLGWKRIGGRWYTKYEAEAAREQFEASRKAYIAWEPQLKKLFVALESSQASVRADAEKKLLTIKAPEALDVLETLCAQSPEDIQLLVVDAIDRMKSPKASLLLAKMALTNPFGAVGQAASKSLKNRPADHYVPPLLSLLSCPIAARMGLFQSPRGQIVLQQMYVRELNDHKQQINVTRVFNDRNYIKTNNIGAEQLAKEAAIQNRRVEDQNDELKLRNKNVMTVLKDTTGAELGDDPSAWWQWWYDSNGVTLLGEKPTFVKSFAYVTNVYVPYSPPGYTPDIKKPISCFVVGTPVWTIRGQVPVEQVQVGDPVLSQNVETGELTYKPVLKPTIRPPVSIISIKTDKGTIRCSPGHPFWVPGKGWVMALRLEAGMRLHDVAGTAEIQEVVKEERVEKVYNLIVADFHTYFVGEGKFLVHDNTMREPTSATVPGLVAK